MCMYVFTDANVTQIRQTHHSVGSNSIEVAENDVSTLSSIYNLTSAYSHRVIQFKISRKDTS